MNICVISPWYPVGDDTKYAFVEQLVNEFERIGHDCVVISPFNTFNEKAENYPPELELKNVQGTRIVKVYRPRFRMRNIPLLPISTVRYCAMKAFEKVIKDENIPVDCIYCHFFVSALIGWHYSHKKNIPLYIATGESVIPKKLQKAHCFFSWSKLREDTNGVICVSTKNLNECVTLGYAMKEKCIVLPNSVDETIFKKLDKAQCKDALCLPQECYIVAFVGWFIERKGANRVSQAIELIGEEKIRSVFIGRSTDDNSYEPTGTHIIFKGQVPHNKIPLYLNAADVFVLPTKAEGCCNAVVEAMACGLPIISSNLPFNWDVLNEDNSFLVDPSNIGQIKDAIYTLYKNKSLSAKLSLGSLRKADSLRITERAKRICFFMEEKKAPQQKL